MRCVRSIAFRRCLRSPGMWAGAGQRDGQNLSQTRRLAERPQRPGCVAAVSPLEERSRGSGRRQRTAVPVLGAVRPAPQGGSKYLFTRTCCADCGSQGYGEHARCCQTALIQGVRGDGVRAQHRGGDISDAGENGAILGPNQGSITARPTRAVGRLGGSNRGWEVTSCSAANIARGARHFFPRASLRHHRDVVT